MAALTPRAALLQLLRTTDRDFEYAVDKFLIEHGGLFKDLGSEPLRKNSGEAKTPRLEWADTRTIVFDDTVIFGHGWDSFGCAQLRQEAHIPGASYLIWPENGKWSLYDTSDGGLCYCRFATEEEAKAKAEEWARSFSATAPSSSPPGRSGGPSVFGGFP